MELNALKRSLSRYELGVCLIILSILFYYAIEKISEVSVYTEQTGIEVMLRNMQSNLNLYKSEKLISGNLMQMADMIHANPVGTIFPRPRNYAGEYDVPDPSDFSPGDWYFDRTNGYLVYMVIHGDRFSSKLPPPPRIRLTLEPAYVDRNNNGIFDRDVDRFSGLILKKVDTYGWK